MLSVGAIKRAFQACVYIGPVSVLSNPDRDNENRVAVNPVHDPVSACGMNGAISRKVSGKRLSPLVRIGFEVMQFIDYRFPDIGPE